MGKLYSYIINSTGIWLPDIYQQRIKTKNSYIREMSYVTYITYIF